MVLQLITDYNSPVLGVRHEENNTTLYINNKEVGKGTLYITERILSWAKSDTQVAILVEYPSISLHAISRDVQVHPRHNLYVMVDVKIETRDFFFLNNEENNTENNDNNDNNDDDDDDEDSENPITELRFVPDNTNNLDAMFQAMKACQALHPDPQDSFSDADEDVYEDAEEDEFEYYEAGAGDAPYIINAEQVGAMYNGTEAEEAMDVEAGQFEDAEEDP